MKNIFIPCLTWLTLLSTVTLAWCDTYRIEAESFPEQKFWKVSLGKDMSDGKLLFSGSVENNEIEGMVHLPKDGAYTLWVRSGSMGGGFRKYEVEINGKKCGMIFGDEKGRGASTGTMDLIFTEGDVFDLKAGPNRIRILPKSPYSRCDVLILTDEKDFVPPNVRVQIEKIQSLSFQN